MSKYSVGANFERRVIKELEKDGWFCLRSAGSKKPADVVAFRYGEVRFIQCQISSYFASIKKEQLIELAKDNGFEAWLAWREKRQIQMGRIYPN